MARSIGVKNINLVKRLTTAAINRRKTPYGVVSYVGIEEEVVGELPLKLWDTWEMADQQIRRIINDITMGEVYK
jgi:hypothetical protein